MICSYLLLKYKKGNSNCNIFILSKYTLIFTIFLNNFDNFIVFGYYISMRTEQFI